MDYSKSLCLLLIEMGGRRSRPSSDTECRAEDLEELGPAMENQPAEALI